MRLSELLDAEVVDAAGAPAGRVLDVRLVRDGPLLASFGASYRVQGLIVGPRQFGARLGYDRVQQRGPWLLRAVVGRMHRRDRFVPWASVAGLAHRRVELAVATDDLPPVPLLP